MTALFATTGADSTPIGTATIAAATDVFTLTGHGLTNGQQVAITSPTGGAVGVLVVNAPYFVRNSTLDTFQLSPSPGAPVMLFSSDGGCALDRAQAVYTGQQLRQALGGLMYKGRFGTPDFGRFGARLGVLRNSTSVEVSVSGLTVTVNDLNAVINPIAGGTQGGPYLCAVPTAQHPLNAADPIDPRIDTLIAEVLDTAEDASGLIVARTRVITGTPAPTPVAPVAPDGTLELARLTVPALAISATLNYTAPFTVAAGGVLPVAAAAGLPSAIVREGMYADQADTDSLMRYSGTAWEAVASAKGFQFWQTITYDANGTFAKADFPGLRAVRIRAQGGGGAGGGAVATAATGASSGGGGQGGNYAEKFVLATALSASETVTRGAGGTGVVSGDGNAGGTSSVGAHCSAAGGAGGIQGANTTDTFLATISGTPNTTATGDMVRVGDAGEFGLVNGSRNFALAGGGGSSMWGGGPRARQPGAGADGFPGGVYGAGGGGGANANSQAAGKAGGVGGNGRVLIDLYI